MISQPFFSVVIPTYNRSQFITKTLDAVLKQEFSSCEIVVVDDGSTDDTETMVRSFNDPKIVYLKKTNGERGAARNFGWKHAKGDYVTFLDSDDLLYSDHLQTAYSQIVSLGYPACFAQAYETKEADSGKIILNGYRSKNKLINKEIFKGNFLACFGVFIKREVINEIKFEEERQFAGSEDWLLWLQLSARHPLYFNNKVTGALVQHEQRSVNALNADNLLFRAEFIKKKLEADPVFLKAFSKKGVHKAYSHVLTYACLHLATTEKRKTLHYFTKAIWANARELMTQRSLAIFKKILISR